MATLSIDPTVSPRIITVLSPDTEISVQELVDKCRDWEDDPENMVYPSLISAAGKEQLGGGTSVGITATLLNALLAFEARPGPTYVQCNVSGGNLVALQADLQTYYTTPIQPTSFTQVVTTASSSATTQNQEQLEFASFLGGVAVKGSSPYSGTEFPVGTREYPVNNFVDAHTIAELRGMNTFFIMESITMDTGDSFTDGYIFKGDSPVTVTLTLNPGALIQNATFEKLTLEGTLDGNCIARDCSINNLNYVEGFIYQSALNGTITVAPGSQASVLDCWSNLAGQGQHPHISMSGTGSLALRNYHGGIGIQNATGSGDISLDMSSGIVHIDNTNTDPAVITIRGVCEINDTSGSNVVNDATVTTRIGNSVPDLVWDVATSSHTNTGTFGAFMQSKLLTVAKFLGLK